jgi:hypothetical protein
MLLTRRPRSFADPTIERFVGTLEDIDEIHENKFTAENGAEFCDQAIGVFGVSLATSADLTTVGNALSRISFESFAY